MCNLPEASRSDGLGRIGLRGWHQASFTWFASHYCDGKLWSTPLKPKLRRKARKNWDAITAELLERNSARSREKLITRILFEGSIFSHASECSIESSDIARRCGNKVSSFAGAVCTFKSHHVNSDTWVERLRSRLTKLPCILRIVGRKNSSRVGKSYEIMVLPKASTLDARHYPRYDRRASLKPSFDENPDEISEQLHFASQLESDGSATAHLYGENFPLIIITVIIL